MDSTISEPFLLSSYGILQEGGRTALPNGRTPGVYASYGQASSSSDGYVTVSAHGDGVHVVDISTLHPVASYALGPTCVFSCPAVSRISQQDRATICVTYASIISAPGMNKTEIGRTIWSWRENLSGEVQSKSQKKQSPVIPHPISRIYAPEDLSTILVVSPKTQVTIVDADLVVKNTYTPSGCDQRTLLNTFIFPRKSCAFAPSHTGPAEGVVLLLLSSIGMTLYLQALGITDDNIVELGPIIQVLADAVRSITGISCSPEGYLTVLIGSGPWRSFRLESVDGTSVDVFPVTEYARLSGLFLSSHHVSILSAGSSHVLLAGVTNAPKPEIALLLWDLQYTILLASHTIPIPSTLPLLSQNGSSFDLNLVSTTSSQALLALTPHLTRMTTPSTYRSSVLVVPYTAPSVSTIASAMGRSSAGLKWLVNLSMSDVCLNKEQKEVLESMSNAMTQNGPEAAKTAFFDWKDREMQGKPPLDDTFVRRVLAIVLQNLKPGTIFVPDVLRYLISAGVVSANMVEGGLVSALLAQNDWKSVRLTINNVLDVSETDVILALRSVVAHHRRRIVADDDYMQVDAGTTTEVSSLPSFVALCLSFKCSPSLMRVALRKHLHDAEDLVCVLEVLESWMTSWLTMDLLPVGSTSPPEAPPLSKVLLFLQALLDASFVALLQYTPSHPLLQAIGAHLQPELMFIDQAVQLCEPLKHFAKAQAKGQKKFNATDEKQKKGKDLKGWQKKKTKMREHSGTVGLYRLEELVL